MLLQFHLKYHTDYGESLCLIFTTEADEEQVVPMEYLNHDFWKATVDTQAWPLAGKILRYRYSFTGKDGEIIPEDGGGRSITLSKKGNVKTYDVWNYAGYYENAFYTAPFRHTLLPQPAAAIVNALAKSTHTFKVKAPLLRSDELVCVLGNTAAMHHWDEQSPLLLHNTEDWWTISLDLEAAVFPVAYKYGIYNTTTQSFSVYEQGDNRLCFEPETKNTALIYHDGFIRLPHECWKGAGVAIPVFSLRSYNSWGIGEFTDIPLLVDWANKTALRLIQILPINDTTAFKTWQDSYPYSAISAFALHPIYLHVPAVAAGQYDSVIADVQAQQQVLNVLPAVDYEAVLTIKLKALQKIYKVAGAACMQTVAFKNFFDNNKHWLQPYAVFCYLRDQYTTADFTKWKKDSVYSEALVNSYFDTNAPALSEVYFHCYLQYHLHCQLQQAVAYAHEKGVVLKGDIPIGICSNSVDAWVSPALYNMDMQAGAPPDDFAIAGQNWGFPTYNWHRMQADGFAWWKQRFEQMSNYFDAFRIDHILGFFRIWSIPLHAVQGIMGRFDPCLPVHISEFSSRHISFDYDRFCKPFINEIVLRDIFGPATSEVKAQFLLSKDGFNYELQPQFNTQRKVEQWFHTQEPTEANQAIRSGLYDVIANVLLFEEEGSQGQAFHFRIAMDHTLSYQALPHYVKEQLAQLYIDYFFNRQNDFWRKEAMKKLPALKQATHMLICGEDLGMVPASVPFVMKDLGILSLEIQRMPKQNDREFFNPADAPYLSVVTPSTHDMSTIRGWWQENPAATQRFFNTQLHQHGEAPYYCEPWINTAIVVQHLHSPAMWSIFQLQDLLGMDGGLRYSNPWDERINIPANPHHYWCYRMHIFLEDLLNQESFNTTLQAQVQRSGR